MRTSRRSLLAGIGSISAGLILSNCHNTNGSLSSETRFALRQKEETGDGEVTATEDLMREHGVLRRALFVYSEIATRLRSNPSQVSPDGLQKNAKLFRTFGEDYHEKKLEETFIFPVVKKTSGRAADYPDILIAQHKHGRQITDYILAMTQGGKLNTSNAESLARAMSSLVRMYRPHAAREDTVVFPSWKQALTAEQLNEMNEKFEDIEHEMFGKDGFENAVRQISDIEKEFGLADLSLFTAPSITV